MKYRPEDDQNMQAAEQAKRDQAIANERHRWWQLAESYRRCVEIAKDEWEHVLDLAEQQQHDTALEMRDRTTPAVRATGKEYDADKHIPVPLFTPRDRVQFLKEVATTLLISADRQNLPVTKAGRRETQPDEAAAETDAALTIEAHELAQAGEAPAVGDGALAFSEAAQRVIPPVGANGE